MPPQRKGNSRRPDGQEPPRGRKPARRKGAPAAGGASKKKSTSARHVRRKPSSAPASKEPKPARLGRGRRAAAAAPKESKPRRKALPAPSAREPRGRRGFLEPSRAAGAPPPPTPEVAPEGWTEEIYRILGFPSPLWGGPPSAASLVTTGAEETHVAVLARDPYWLFAFWEISTASLEEAAEDWDGKLKGAVLVLRLYGAEDGGEELLIEEISLPQPRNSRYLKVPTADRMYFLEVGLRSPRGEYRPLARSQAVRTPPDATAPFTGAQGGERVRQLLAYYEGILPGEPSGPSSERGGRRLGPGGSPSSWNPS